MPSKPRRSRPVEIIPRRQRKGGVPFGRSRIGAPPGELTDLGCPDCRGVLAVLEEGGQGHLSFTCRVGHAFSGESLIEVKEQQLEDTLWTAVEVFEEVLLLHKELAARARRAGAGPVASAYDRRSKRGEVHMARLRSLIAADGRAPTSGNPG